MTGFHHEYLHVVVNKAEDKSRSLSRVKSEKASRLILWHPTRRRTFLTKRLFIITRSGAVGSVLECVSSSQHFRTDDRACNLNLRVRVFEGLNFIVEDLLGNV